ncbi:bifunctional DNA primase/polymerase [Actinoplanes sp. NPDC049596]|uniref:bifunctional DNA primase/polymerase n=1 Tax=unclassified Actinoplanes TaxID=2626549 RepID=UPI00343D6870
MTGPVTAAALAAAAGAGEGAPEGEGMLRVALAYAALGLPVLPLHHMVGDGSCSCGHPEHVIGGCEEADIAKHPRTANGVHDASTDRTVIESWWWRWPSSNPGIATGHGIDVIDVDDVNGWQNVADVAAAGRMPAVIAYASTGRAGGLHVVVASTGGRNKQKMLPGVDYRGVGGYVVAAPAVHRSGRTYAWTPVILPAGDPALGASLGADLGWLLTSPATSGRGAPGASRQSAWVSHRLEAQCAKVRHASATERNTMVWSAGIAMGAVTEAGWIKPAEVRRALLNAYTAAGGNNPTKAADTIIRALDCGKHHPLPDLGERGPLDPAGVIARVRAWSWSVRRMSGGQRVVLEWVLQEAEKRGTTTLRLAVRDVAVNAGVSRGSAGRALRWLCDRAVLAVVSNGSKRSATAGVYRLLDAGQVTAIGHEAVPPAAGPAPAGLTRAAASTIGHDLWSSRRGLGRGLTQADRRLLAALPADPNATLTNVEWAEAAGVHRATATKATRTASPVSLASLGLVSKMPPGRIAATEHGHHLGQVLRGEITDPAAIDSLAADLDVAGRREQRAAAVAAERLRHSTGLLPAVIADALLGRTGKPQDLRLLRTALPPSAITALASLLIWLDQTPRSRPVRHSVLDVVKAAAITRTPIPPHSHSEVLRWAAPTTPIMEQLDTNLHEWPAHIHAITTLIVGVRRSIAATQQNHRALHSHDAGSTLSPLADAIETVSMMLMIDPLPSPTDITAWRSRTAHPRKARLPGCDAPSPGYRPVGEQRIRGLTSSAAPTVPDKDLCRRPRAA